MKLITKDNANKHLFPHLISATRMRVKYASLSASGKSSGHPGRSDAAKSLNQGINIRATEPGGVINVRAPHNQKRGNTVEHRERMN